MSFYPTVRNTFISDDPNLIITYSNPSVTPFESYEEVEDTEDIMYFYYGIHIYYKNKLLLEAHTHDYPKVLDLSSVIDYLLSEDGWELDDAIGGTAFTYYIKNKKTYYHNDLFEREYSYHFEAMKIETFRDNKRTIDYEYILTIDNKRILNRYKSEDEKISTPVRIVLTKEELVRLRSVAESFMKKSIEVYNKYELPELIKWREENNYED